MPVNEKTEDSVWQALTAALGSQIEQVEQRQARRAIVRVSDDDLPGVARVLFEQFGGRLATVTGLDVRDGVQLLYHFCLEPTGLVVTVKTTAPRPDMAIDSITPMIPGAEFIEREIADLLGVTFRNHPRMERLSVADDWPEGVYPLRRDFDAKSQNPSAFEGVSREAPGRGK